MESYKKNVVVIVTLYFFSYLFIILNQGIFWDDWVFFNMKSNIISSTFHQAGLYWFGYFHIFLLFLKNGIIIYHFLVFFGYLFSALLLYGILKNVREIGDSERIFIVLFFALFPVNSARISFVDTPYAICNFMFFLGFWFTVKYYDGKKLLFRIISLLVLFFSFTTSSFLVFYVLLILYILYHEKLNLKPLFSISNLKILLKMSDYLVLPILFWVIKILYFTPFGLYKGYNQLTLKSLCLAPFLSLVQFYTSFIQVLALSLTSVSVFVIIGAILITLMVSKRDLEIGTSKSSDFSLFILGLVTFFLGVFPYVAVYCLPTNFDWSSRHQLLVPLGASLILYYGLKLFFSYLDVKPKMKQFLMILIIVAFMKVNFNIYLDYQRDWYKQLSIIENMKLSDELRNNHTFLFKDNTSDLNAQHRKYRFYEYAGLMKYSFGNQTRFGMDFDEFPKMGQYRPFSNEHYNLKDYQEEKPEYTIFVNRGTYEIKDFKGMIELKYYEIFRPKEFWGRVNQMVTLSYKKLT